MKGISVDYERSSDGDLTYVRLVGRIDETFDGIRVAARIKSKRVVLNCGGISLITSFGIRGWNDFIKEFERRKSELFYVECSSAFINELNQVVSFGGYGHVVSGYAPYSCRPCGVDRAMLLRTDLDGEAIRRGEPPVFSCEVCGEALEFDEAPSAFFPALERHLEERLDDVVLAFLEARLGYESDHRQLEVQKDFSDNTTVLLFRGMLDGTLNGPRLAQGLQGAVAFDLTNIIHVQPQGLRAFRQLLELSLNKAERLYLIGTPLLVVERALGGLSPTNAPVLSSVRVPYYCQHCEGTDFALLDLETREGKSFRAGRSPARRCVGCKRPSAPLVGSRVIEQLRLLPEPELPRSVSKSVRDASKRLEASKKERWAASSQRPRRVSMLAIVAAVCAVGAGLAAAAATTTLIWKSDRDDDRATAAAQTPAVPTTERPDWIVSAVPSSSYCTDLGWQLQCVGIASFQSSKEAATREAFEGAVEAFAHSALLNQEGEAAERQRKLYSSARADATRALEQATYGEDADAQAVASEAIRKARGNVAELVALQSAPGAPNKRADWHWEEYEESNGSGTEFLVFARVDVAKEEVQAFRDFYSRRFDAGGASFVPLLPGMGWVVDPSDKSGFYISSVTDGPVRKAGFQRGDAILVERDLASADDVGVAIAGAIKADEVVRSELRIQGSP